MKRTKYKQVTLLIFASMVFFVSAQEENRSPAAIEKMKLNWLWNKTANAAGLKLDNLQTYSLLQGEYHTENGTFHRVMDGEKKNRLALKTEGGVNIKDFYFWGKFNYSRDAIKDAMYNASIIDPYRGMPYTVADTNSSNWNNQHYELEFKINFPKINNRLAIGVDGQYHTSIGAKQRDIRTENYYMFLSIRPGVVYSLSPKNHIGFNFEYFSLKEESNMSNVNTYINQPFYQLHGLGNATEGIGQGRTTNYIGNNVGGGVQYNYLGAVNLLLSSNYSMKVEDAEVSFTNPRKVGSVIDKVWYNKLLLHTSGYSHTHYVELEYLNRHIDGIEYITEFDDSETFQGYVTLYQGIRSTYANKIASASYTWTKNKQDEYSWLLGAKLSYLEFNDEYLLPHSEDNGENVRVELTGKRNFVLSNKLTKRLLIDGSILISNNINGNYIYGGAFKQYPVNDELVGRDNNFSNAKFMKAMLYTTYSQQVRSSNNLNLYIRAGGSFAKTNSYDFNNRTNLTVSIGCNF